MKKTAPNKTPTKRSYIRKNSNSKKNQIVEKEASSYFPQTNFLEQDTQSVTKKTRKTRSSKKVVDLNVEENLRELNSTFSETINLLAAKETLFVESQNQITTLTLELKRKDEVNNKNEKDLLDIKKDLVKLEKNHSKLAKENKILTSTTAQLKQEKLALHEKIELETQEVSKLNESLKNINTSYSQAIEKNNELTKTVSQLKQGNSELFQQLKNETEKFSNSIIEKVTEINSLKNAKQELDEEFENLKTRYSTLLETSTFEVESLEKEKTILSSTIAKLKQAKLLLNEEIELETQKVNDLTEKLEDVKTESSQIIKENNDNKSQIINLEKELAETTQDFSERIADFKKQIESINEVQTQVLSQKAHLEDELKKTKSKNDDLEKELQIAKSKNIEFSKELNKLRIDLNTSYKENKSLITQITSLRARIGEISNSNESLKREKRDLQEKIEKARQLFNNLLNPEANILYPSFHVTQSDLSVSTDSVKTAIKEVLDELNSTKGFTVNNKKGVIGILSKTYPEILGGFILFVNPNLHQFISNHFYILLFNFVCFVIIRRNSPFLNLFGIIPLLIFVNCIYFVFTFN